MPAGRFLASMALATFVLIRPGLLSGQNVDGGLTGRVLDASGRAIAEVRVEVWGPEIQGVRLGASDDRGLFHIAGLPVGLCTVRASRVGYRSVRFEDVSILLGTITNLGDIGFQPDAIQLPDLVVDADRPVIDPLNPGMISGLDARDFESFPVAGRNFHSILQTLPHANASFLGDEIVIGGSTGLENTYYVDGANVTGPRLGRGGTRLPWNFVQSASVRNGGYQAEFGKALGGIVDVVTHSGANDFEARTFGFFRGSALADKPRTGLADLRADAFHEIDAGFRLGGPLISDHLWYSAGYNLRVESSDREVIEGTTFVDRETIHAFMGKLKWNPSVDTDVEFSVFGDPSSGDAVGAAIPSLPSPGNVLNPETLVGNRRAGGGAISARIRHRGSETLSLTADFSGHWRTDALQPASASDTPLTLFVDNTTNSWSGGLGNQEESRAQRLGFNLAASLSLGSHSPKFGFGYENNRVDFVFRSDLLTLIDDDSYFWTRQHSEGEHHNRTPSIFLQDTWRINERWALNTGLRWSQQRLAGDGGSGAQAFPGEWQPRAGIVFQPGTVGTQRVFASFGRFYQQLPVYFSTLFNAPFTLELSWFGADPRATDVMPDSSLDLTLDTFPELGSLSAEHFDEVTGGYERSVGRGYVLGARVIHRVLRTAFGYGVNGDRSSYEIIGNFGEGALDFLPKPERKYSALELTLRRGGPAHALRGHLTYVLSRTHGNYAGLFASDQGVAAPHNTPSYKFEEQGHNSTGLLPNHRTHVVKLRASYRASARLEVGTFISVQSGSPLNEFGAGAQCPFCPVFLVKRGSAGRSPVLWDVNVTSFYDVKMAGMDGRFHVDLLHLGSPRRATWLDQTRFLSQDPEGNQINPNPNFGRPLAYQPPMAVRLGFELGIGNQEH